MTQPASKEFQPIWDDARLNDPESNALILKLLSGEISILPLFECEPKLFEELQKEASTIRFKYAGQRVEGDQATAKYVSAQDQTWKVKPDSVHQYSLYNSTGDFLYSADDHHWSSANRRFHPTLIAIPKFYRRYFLDSELQNFRLQSLSNEGSLGQHREKIIGIPNRERHYKLRFHLPIITNPEVEFFMNGLTYKMQAGWVHIFNQSCLHGVKNAGEQIRIHLVWDCYLNDYILRSMIAPAIAGA